MNNTPQDHPIEDTEKNNSNQVKIHMNI